MAKWQKKANKLLKSHYSKRDGFYIRIVATQYPKPTFAFLIYEEGEKLTELAVYNPEEFVEDINDAWEIIKPHYEKWLKEQKNRNDEEDEEDEEDEDEEKPKRKKKSRRKSKKRKIKRD